MVKYFRKIHCSLVIIQLLIIQSIHQFPQINHYLSLLDTDVVLCMHFHKQYLFEASLKLIHGLLTLHSTTQSRISLPATFTFGPLVLLTEKYPCNTMQVQRCTSTNAWGVKSSMIVVTGTTVVLVFYQKITGYAYTSILKS